MKRLTSHSLFALIAASAIAIGSACATAADATLDTTKLPRIPGAVETYATPPATMYTAKSTVAAVADAAISVLAADGWQRYRAPFAEEAKIETMRLMSFKKGSEAISVFVTAAAAAGDATSVQYTGIALDHDLAFPKDASDIEFDPTRPHLALKTKASVADTLSFFTADLATKGWTQWMPPQGAKGANTITDTNATVFFVSDGKDKPLLVSLHRIETGITTAKIEAIPASVIADLSKPKEEAASATPPPAAAPDAVSKAPAPPLAPDAFDTLAGDIMKEVGKAVEGIATDARAGKIGGGLTLPKLKPAEKTAAATPEPTLTAEIKKGLPQPSPHRSASVETTLFLVLTTATVEAKLDTVLAFYRRELASLGWTEESKDARLAPDDAIIPFASAAGPLVLKLNQSAGLTTAELAWRKRAEAEKSGLLPKPGEARLLLGSAMETEAVLTIAGRSVTLTPGIGSKKPDGPTLEVAPGKYRFSYTAKGTPPVEDEIEVKAGEIWGVLIGDGSALPMQMY